MTQIFVCDEFEVSGCVDQSKIFDPAIITDEGECLLFLSTITWAMLA